MTVRDTVLQQEWKATCSSASLIFFSNSAIFSEATYRGPIGQQTRAISELHMEPDEPGAFGTFARSATIVASLSHFISAHIDS
jgi:hypothetical protein